MIRQHFLIAVLLITTLFSQAQNYRITGFVYDKESQEPLIGANIYDLGTLQGTSSNNFGYFNFVLHAGTAQLNISFIGYETFQLSLSVISDTIVNVYLDKGKEIGEVTIKSQRTFTDNAFTAVSISSEQIRLLPTVTGETDLMNAYQYLPGIAQGSEGDNSLYVRGGSPDQNLILIDDVPMYYVNHVGGLVSIFDENAISNVSVYKGGFPSRYGGRLSSVVDIRMKNGNMNHFGGEVSVGLISSKLSFEGPIVKDKISFMVTARKSMTDLYMIPFSRHYFDNDGSVLYSFIDLNGKINFKVSDKDRLYLSVYHGKDRVSLNMDFDMENKDMMGGKDNFEDMGFLLNTENAWGNKMACFRWNHVLKKNLFSNISFAISDYFYKNALKSEVLVTEANLLSESFQYSFESGITDKMLKVDFDFFPSNNHRIKFGGASILHKFNPGELKHVGRTYDLEIENSHLYQISGRANIDTTYTSGKVNAIQSSVYVEDNIKLFNALLINAGVHASSYLYDGNPFFSLQPRLSVKYLFKNNFFINASYANMTQYMHMLTGSDTSIPSDIWLPATKEAKPEHSQNISIGFGKKYPNSGIQFTIDAYYKAMSGLVDYKLGSSLIKGSEAWFDKIEVDGIGEAFGVEFLFEKTRGLFTGWIAYTLSKSTRQFENINNGNIYPYVYDRPHDISIVGNYKLNKKITFSGTWEYRSGRRMTLGAANYNSIVFKTTSDLPPDEGQISYWSSKYRDNIMQTTHKPVFIYGVKNNYKLQDYHKLNLSAHFFKQKKNGERIFTVGVHNLYNRKNPYNIYYEQQKNGIVSLKKVALFPIMPNISYSYKF